MFYLYTLYYLELQKWYFLYNHKQFCSKVPIFVRPKLTSDNCYVSCFLTEKTPLTLILVASSWDILKLFLANVYGISGGITEFRNNRNTSIAYLAYKSASRLTLRSILMFLQGPEHLTM